MNSVIILAAGYGSRMKTDNHKCLNKIFDKTIIEYIVDESKQCNVDKVICVVGHKKEEIENILKDKVEYAIQDKLLGTAHAVLQTKELVCKNGFSLIVPGDTAFVNKDILNKVIKHHKDKLNDITIATFKIDNPSGYGRIIKQKGQVIKIVEEKMLTDKQKKIKLVNSGVMCVNNDILFDLLLKVKENSINEFYLTDIVELCSGRVGNISFKSSNMLGINDLCDLHSALNKKKKQINKNHLKNGVNIIDINNTYIAPSVKIDKFVTIYPNCYITGDSIIGSRCIIKNNCNISNSKIHQNVTIQNSTIKDSTIKENTTVGPYAMIRDNSTIGKSCRIGNFVEIKNSILKDNNKVAHHVYIGDTISGNNVNFGCGSITVNYNGKQKFKTIIEDNVFIGSNVNLIAPICVKENSFIAAGSSVSKVVEKDSFVIERSNTITKNNNLT